MRKPLKDKNRLLGRVVSVTRPDFDKPDSPDFKTGDAALVIGTSGDFVGILSFTTGEKSCVNPDRCTPLRKGDAQHYLHGLAVERFYTRNMEAS